MTSEGLEPVGASQELTHNSAELVEYKVESARQRKPEGRMYAKILIVEDDTDTQLALSIRLQSSGFAVLHAHSIATAIKLVSCASPDLIMLDLSLPDGDGYGLMQKLKSSATKSSIPVIILSGRELDGNADRSHESGAFAFFQKGMSYELILSSIQKALGERFSKKC